MKRKIGISSYTQAYYHNMGVMTAMKLVTMTVILNQQQGINIIECFL